MREQFVAVRCTNDGLVFNLLESLALRNCGNIAGHSAITTDAELAERLQAEEDAAAARRAVAGEEVQFDDDELDVSGLGI
jgi:tRNA A37 threonylcarbamoyladenosine synthetase subunit TsaC/SUA5/YrdC